MTLWWDVAKALTGMESTAISYRGFVGSDIVVGCSLGSDRGGVNSYIVISICTERQTYFFKGVLGWGQSEWILDDLVVETPHIQCEW